MAKPRKHYDQDRAAARRKQVLDAAEACFLRHGFHGASMAEISRAAGMSVGHIYNYFSSKEDIVKAMGDQEMTRLLARFQAMAADRALYLKELQALLHEEIGEAANVECSRLIRDLIGELDRNETITTVMREFDQLLRGEMLAMCRAHKPELPAEQAGARIEVFLVLLHGYGLRAALNPGIDAQSYAREVNALILHLFG